MESDNNQAVQRKTLDERAKMSELERLRHSCAHVMATAILRLWPEAQFAYGPPVENGFYYGVELGHRITPEDFPAIETEMKKEIKANHVFERSQTKTWDPEGTLSTLPAVATALLGLAAGRWLSSERTLALRVKGPAAAGGCLTAAGLAWGLAFPVNKNLWSSSQVVFTAGAAMICLAAFLWMIDVRGWKSVAAPAVAFGIKPMLAFFGSGIMARVLSMVKVDFEGNRISFQRAVHESAFASWLPDNIASLSWAVAFVLIWLGILWPLWKKGIVWKVQLSLLRAGRRPHHQRRSLPFEASIRALFIGILIASSFWVMRPFLTPLSGHP